MRFNLTPGLKRHAIKHYGCKPTNTEAEYRTAIAKALATGVLKAPQLALLSRTVPTPQPVRKSTTTVQVPVRRQVVNPAPNFQASIEAGVRKAMAGMGGVGGNRPAPTPTPSNKPKPGEFMAKHAEIRVKAAIESYSGSRKGAIYPTRHGKSQNGSNHLLAGQPVVFDNMGMDHPSERDKAVAQAWYKWAVSKQIAPNETPRWLRFTDHDKDLMNHAMRNEKWSGFVGAREGDGGDRLYRTKMNDLQVKTLLDDSTSGAIEATPIAFDDAIVLFPVLYGELFPYVNVVDVARGRRMKSAALNQPTMTWGVNEGTAITPFTTDGMVTAFDTTVYPVVGALELGLDLEEDSPVGLGNKIIDYYGLKFQEQLDYVIAYGNGTSQPQGIFNVTNPTLVPSDNGAGGPVTVSDMEGLMFGVSKKYRIEAGAVLAYVSNDTMYRRARAVPVGPGDERRVFGMTHAGYQILDNPWKIQNDIPNGLIAFANLKRYRMYRRLGLNVKVETAGRTLSLSHTKLIVVRGRFGGQMETGGAVAICNDAQS